MTLTSGTDVIRLELPAQHRYLNAISACVAAILERVEGVSKPAQITYDVSLATHEICTNIVDHGYAGESDGRIAVSLMVENAHRRLVIEVRDNAPPFDPAQIPSPDFEGGQIHGYGLFLVQQLVDQATYTARPDGNCWRLVKNL